MPFSRSFPSRSCYLLLVFWLFSVGGQAQVMENVREEDFETVLSALDSPSLEIQQNALSLLDSNQSYVRGQTFRRFELTKDQEQRLARALEQVLERHQVETSGPAAIILRALHYRGTSIEVSRPLLQQLIEEALARPDVTWGIMNRRTYHKQYHYLTELYLDLYGLDQLAFDFLVGLEDLELLIEALAVYSLKILDERKSGHHAEIRRAILLVEAEWWDLLEARDTALADDTLGVFYLIALRSEEDLAQQALNTLVRLAATFDEAKATPQEYLELVNQGRQENELAPLVPTD